MKEQIRKFFESATTDEQGRMSISVYGPQVKPLTSSQLIERQSRAVRAIGQKLQREIKNER